MAITLTIILAISMHSAIVLAKKPDKPPVNVREIAQFRIWVPETGDSLTEDIVLIANVSEPGTPYFDVKAYVDDWDYTGGVTGGEPREKYKWGFYDGGWGFPFIAFGLFEMNDVFRDGKEDWRPEVTVIDGIEVRLAELIWISHTVIPDNELAHWRIFLNWTRIMDDGRVVDVQLLGRTSIGAFDEGTPSVDEDGKVVSWTVTFTPENSEFKLQYSYTDTFLEEVGKSGKERKVTKYFQEVIWDYQSSLTMTVTIERLPE